MRGLFVLAIIFAPFILSAQSIRLTVEIDGFRNDDGHVMVKLINQEEEMVANKIAGIADGKSTIVFENVPSGTYALSYFHDENDNEDLDTNFFGMPKEGFGFSNNAKGRMGPPKLKDQLFTVTSDLTLSLQTMYL
jgi:uncharacterized protein (DUF2141 family)